MVIGPGAAVLFLSCPRGFLMISGETVRGRSEGGETRELLHDVHMGFGN